jgi:hypothetical protein
MEVAVVICKRVQRKTQEMAKLFLNTLREEMMAKPVSEVVSITKRIFENILFLEEVFESSANEEIPDVPFLELARSFQLKSSERTFPLAPRIAH